MAVAVFMIVLFASMSVGHGNDLLALFNNTFFGPCTKEQLTTMFTGNFSNRCTDIPSIKVIGKFGTTERYYLNSIGYFNDTAGNVVLSHRECAQLFVTYFGLFRIHNLTRLVVDPVTGSKTFRSTLNLHFSPILHPDHTVVIDVSDGTCFGEVRAIILANQGVLGAVACGLFEPDKEEYSFVATLVSHPTNATLAGYVSQVNQAAGQVIPQVRILQDKCPQ